MRAILVSTSNALWGWQVHQSMFLIVSEEDPYFKDDRRSQPNRAEYIPEKTVHQFIWQLVLFNPLRHVFLRDLPH